MAAESIRAKLIDTTARIIRDRGLAAATIREIAAAAGVAEGSVYNHFNGKIDLISAVFVEHMPIRLADAVQRLVRSVGKGSVIANLEALAADAVTAYQQLDSHAAMLASDPETAAALRRELTRRRLGPGRAYEAVAAYLRIEEEQGRVRLTAPPIIVAAALLGACHEYAFVQLFSAYSPFPAQPETYAQQLVRSLVPSPDDDEGAYLP